MRHIYLFLLLSLFSCQKDEPKTDDSIAIYDIETTMYNLYNPSPNHVLVASHRGDANEAPENTIAAVQAAIEGGASIVEIDLRITSDNELVVIHDSDLDRTTNGTGKVSDRSLEYIKKLKTADKNGKLTEHGVPTLKELMQYAKGKVIIFIDKGEDYWAQIYDILIETETVDQALVIENYEIDRAKREMGKLYNELNYMCRLRQTDDDSPKLFTDFINEPIPGFEFRFYSEDANILAYIEDCKATGKHVLMTTLSSNMAAGRTDKQSLSDPDAGWGWGWCIEKGATIILTDYPKQLSLYLKSKRLN